MALSGASFRSYVLLSIFLSGAVVGHAAFQKRFFYRTMVYLGESKLAFMAAANLALVSIMLVWKAVQRVFLGPLRFREVERLNTRARDAIIECCFATTIFRDEVNLVFLALVTTLLMLKSLHWLAKDRMDFLEEQPLSPRIAHVRLVGLMGLLFITDSYLVWECAKTTFRTRGGTMLVLFAFEFTVLLIELCSDFVRYVFHAIDLRLEGRWDSKGLYSFYNELVTDMCQLTVYLAFFLYVHTFYTFPLHILREVYITFTKFQRRCSDFIRYRRVVSTMNELFADATEEELAQGDRTCIICREEMTEAKKLACGHMFHARCLQSWLKRQLSCPTCRTNVDVNPTSQNASGREGQQQPNNNANAQPPVGGAVPPPPDDAQQGPGFWDHARRLWRHVVFGAPRDGEPQQPPQQQNPQQQPRARVVQRRFWPNVRFGIRVERAQGVRQRMGNRPQGMGMRQARGFVPIPGMPNFPHELRVPGLPFPIPAGMQVPANMNIPPGQRYAVPNLPRTPILRPAQPNAPPIEQLIAISENLSLVRRQVDSLRDQVQQLLVQATEQAAAQQENAGPASPASSITPVVGDRGSASSIPPVAPASGSASTEVSQRSQTGQSDMPINREENLMANANQTQAQAPESTTEQTEEEREQKELRAKRLAFLGGKSRGGASSSTLVSNSPNDGNDNSSA